MNIESGWKKKSLIWISNNIAFLSLFLTLGLVVDSISLGTTPQFTRVLEILQEKASALDSFSAFFASSGALSLAFLVLLTILLYSQWIDGGRELLQALPAIVRDLLAIVTFTCFVTLLVDEDSTHGFLDFDYLQCSMLITVFLLVLISNFGGLEEDPWVTLKNLGVTAAMVILAHLPELIETRQVHLSWFLFILLDMSLIYIVTIIAKIVFFPGSIITLDLDSKLKKTGFAFLALTVLLPICGLLFALLLTLLALLAQLAFGFEITMDYAPSIVLAHLWVIGGYLLALLKHNPLTFFSFFLGVLYNLAGFARKMKNRSELSADIRTEKTLLFRFCRSFVVSDEEEMNKTIAILGGASAVINGLFVVFRIR